MGTLLHLARRLIGVPLLAEPRAVEAFLVVLGPRVAAGIPGDVTLELPELGRVLPQERTAKALASAATARPGLPERLRGARAQEGEPGATSRGLVESGAVAVVQIHGELVSRDVRAQAMSGDFIGYDAIAAQVRAAVADPRVRGVVLDIDSPGGECAGAFECAAAIRDAARQKPVVAVANPYAFSGGYLLASAASKLLVPASGQVGSIGCYTVHLDMSGADAQRGLRFTFISAGDGKVDGHPHAPISESALAEARDRIGRYYSMFVESVAAGRGLAPEAIEKEIGARGYLGQQAVEIGLADGIGGLDAAIELAGAPQAASFPTSSARRPFPTRRSA